jgi:hypothetical protein
VRAAEARHPEGELAQTLVAGRGGQVHLEPAGLQFGTHQFGQLAGLRDVDLVQHDQPRAVEQGRRALVDRVGGELRLDHVEVADRVPARFQRGAVDHVHQHGAALHVPEELQAEAATQAGAGDQAGDVRDREPDLPGLDHAELGHQRRERVVGDLRPGRGQRRDQARLARAGEADEADVRDGLELQRDVAVLPRLAEQREAGRLAARPARRCRGRRGRPVRRRTAHRFRRGPPAPCRRRP